MSVVSLGSINVDSVYRVTDEELETLRTRYEWFPARGETRTVDDLPSAWGVRADEVRHGGKGANQAVAAAAAGARTDLLGLVGPDHADSAVLDDLDRRGVGVEGVSVASDPTGTAHVFVDDEGDNRIVVSPGANGAVDGEYIDQRYGTIRAADYLLLQNELPVDPVVELLTDLSAEPERPTVILDPAPPEGAGPLLDCDAVDVVTPNEHEYRALREAVEAFDGTVVRKRGGADVLVSTDDRFAVSPPDVRVVDTTGAGDVFNGYVAARLAAGDSLRTAIGVATVAGALSTRGVGARGAVPTPESVETVRS